MIRVAIDAMGGDFAPAAPVAGTALALADGGDFHVQLVGQRDAIEAELNKQHIADRSRIEIVEAPEVIGMGEKPLQAVRGKRKSSIAIGLHLQKERKSDAFISAGNTGACMAASTLILKLYPGFERPAIGAPFPTVNVDQPVLVLDAGANVDCAADELVGFAHLGQIYVRDAWGRPDPAVALLNIGEEEEKGNAAVKEAHRLIAASGLRFIGNVEGRDIVMGRCERGAFDVVVCDGFVGNVMLKFYESMRALVRQLAERELGKEFLQSEGVRRLFGHLDYAKYGGAPLLGVQGVSIIAHGSSSPAALASAVRVAVEIARHHYIQHMDTEFAPRGVPS
jgi:glycerol-3-phosphate acyltransferase PlsX